ncbi:MAG: flagella basal body P-ring formation protein FlgA [Gammaproteobacteria bacterium]|nr:flagella basal body P-ring formation protein FlgA [Gammaproteobacteria bacterium]
MQLMRVISVLSLSVWTPLATAAFPGGGVALVEEATSWVSQQTGVPKDVIQMSAPDRRVPIERCLQPLSFRFPFKGNQRTVEALCQEPSWKRFIRVKISAKTKVVAAAQDLPDGHIINSSDLKIVPYPVSIDGSYSDANDLIGLTLIKPVDTDTVINQSMVINEEVIFTTKRAFEAGELIERTALTRFKTNNPPPNALTKWPTGVITASDYLEANQTLSKSNIEQSEYVVVSATNIVRGQVITRDLISKTLQPKKQIGAQMLSTFEEAIGLEATRTIRAGTPLSVSDVTAADLIRKGEKVTLIVKRGALTITVDTIAMEDGKIGEQVELSNTESGKVIRGIVSGRHQASGIDP